MNIMWISILLVVCFAPAGIYHGITKKYAGEPAILKEKSKRK